MSAPSLTAHFPEGDTIHNTLGSLLLGNLASGVFFGITIVQVYLYFVRAGEDHWFMKSLIVSLLYVALMERTPRIDLSPSLLDAFHLAAITHSIYGYAVTHFGDPTPLVSPDWGILAMTAAGGVSDTIVRGGREAMADFGQRTFIVDKLCIQIEKFCNITAFIVEAKILGNMISIAKVGWILNTGFVAPAVSDILLTVTLFITLRQRQGGADHTVSGSTDSIIASLIFYSIQSGALTCILAIVCLVTVRFVSGGCYLPRWLRRTFHKQHVVKPYTYITFGFYFLMPKVYLNALLATLNARKGLRAHRGRSRGRELISNAFRKLHRRPQKRQHREEELRIQIQTVTERVADAPTQEIELQHHVWEEKGPLQMVIIGGPDHSLVKSRSDGSESAAERGSL
ncbi:hypothetical protein NLI96_g5967 [Meripilus lineatus]|uniref:DUF6534 domain-containing protein n=1 Tax=Meripilus lineatus TaxID=2056292 RepID=A0AAD5V2L2_9APHY|nr:hypothetical protein NLI96_g5967 [Physisporinus lineatus]